MLATRFLRAAQAGSSAASSSINIAAAKPLEPAFVHLPLTNWPSTSTSSSSSSTYYVPLPSYLFSSPPRPDILHQCVVAHLASLRQGTARTKNRAEVRGSGRKIRPQKGSGAARVGDIRSPTRRGGGRAFPKRQKDWSLGLNDKVWKMGVRTALSERWRRGELSIIPSPPVLGDISTRSLNEALTAFPNPLSSSSASTSISASSSLSPSSSSSSKILFLLSSLDPKFALSARNIPSVTIDLVDDIDVFPLLQGDRVVLDVEAVQQLQDWLGRSDGIEEEVMEDEEDLSFLGTSGTNEDGSRRVPPGEESTTQEEVAQQEQQQDGSADRAHGDAIRQEMEKLKKEEANIVDGSEDRPSAKDVL